MINRHFIRVAAQLVDSDLETARAYWRQLVMTEWFTQLLEALDECPNVEGKDKVKKLVTELAEMWKESNEIG